jgi:hypothetical protein
MVMRSCSVIALIALCGCAGIQAAGPSEPSAMLSGGPMTQTRMEFIFADEVDAITGSTGAIRTLVDGFNVYLLSDAPNDRMRIIIPIALVENLNRGVLDILLRANFYSTRDTRYAVSEGIVYSVFLHPISSLSSDLLESALAQVLSLAKTFGSTYSSGEVSLGAPPGTDR